MMMAFPPFHRMLTLLNAHGLQTIAVAPVECRCISEHEAIFLSLVNSLEQHRPKVLRDTVALLVEEEHIGTILAAVSTLGGAMMEAGIFPRTPDAISNAARRDHH
jgi:hypothetical protein